MSKDKRIKEVEKKDYFKELVSFFTIILMIIFIGNLGTLGFYGNLLIKIIFGDWSFLILIYVLISMVKYMIKGHGFNIHSLSFQGLIFLYLALSILSHFTIFEGLGLTSKNVFSKTLELYKNYFKTYNSSYYVGGGIIGLIFFQLSILLMGKTGVIILGIAFIIMGLSYLFNHSLWDFLKRFKRIYGFLNKIRLKIITYFKKLSLLKTDDIPVSKKSRPSLSLLNDVSESANYILQKELSKEGVDKLKNTILNNNLRVNFLNYYVGFNSTTYVLELLTNKLTKEFDILLEIFDYEVFYILDGNIIYLEVKNRFKELLTLKHVFLEFEEENIIPIGLNNNNDLIAMSLFDLKPVLIVGEENSGIKSYIRTFIVSLIINFKTKFQIEILDLKHSFKELRGYSNSINYIDTIDNLNKKIEELIFEYDKRYEIFKYLDVSNINEANEIIDSKNTKIEHLFPIFIVLNLSFNFLSDNIRQKIEYLINTGKKVGIYLIIIVRENDKLPNYNLALFNFLIFHLKDLSMSVHLLNSDIACFLDTKGDFLYLENKKISHGQTPYCSMTDYLKVLEKFTS